MVSGDVQAVLRRNGVTYEQAYHEIRRAAELLEVPFTMPKEGP